MMLIFNFFEPRGKIEKSLADSPPNKQDTRIASAIKNYIKN